MALITVEAIVGKSLWPCRSLVPCQPDIEAMPSAQVALTTAPMTKAPIPKPGEPCHVLGSNILTMMYAACMDPIPSPKVHPYGMLLQVLTVLGRPVTTSTSIDWDAPMRSMVGASASHDVLMTISARTILSTATAKSIPTTMP